MGRKPDGAMP
ncbi:hypothetical protein CLOM_g6480, partial [Closterium sp. NIES-68]